MFPYNQVIGTGKLENEVDTEPLDELTITIDWADEAPSSPLNSNSLGGEKEDGYRVEVEVYLNEKGKKIINTLASVRDFGDDSQKVLAAVPVSLGLIGISEIFPDNEISKVILILSLMTLPFAKLKLRGRIRADPILRVRCLNCGLQEQMNPVSKTEYEQMKRECQKCGSRDEFQTFLVK